jgi:hypothetical protein
MRKLEEEKLALEDQMERRSGRSRGVLTTHLEPPSDSS